MIIQPNNLNQSLQAIHVAMLKAAQAYWTITYAASTGIPTLPMSGDPNYPLTGIDSSWPVDVQWAAADAAGGSL